jgi:hypothetical protein
MRQHKVFEVYLVGCCRLHSSPARWKTRSGWEPHLTRASPFPMTSHFPLPSGKLSHNYGKSPSFHGTCHYKWWLCMAMLNYQRVYHVLIILFCYIQMFHDFPMLSAFWRMLSHFHSFPTISPCSDYVTIVSPCSRNISIIFGSPLFSHDVPIFLQYKVIMYFHCPMIPALKKHTYIPIIYPFFASPLFPNCPKICTKKKTHIFSLQGQAPQL